MTKFTRKKRWPPFTESEDAMISEMRLGGSKLCEIAKRADRYSSAVRRRLEAIGRKEEDELEEAGN